MCFCLSLAGCVTSVDKALPYERLPEITVATEVSLVASPSHPAAYLPSDPIPAGEQVRVIGTDLNAAWLMVLYDNRLGWMPTVYSRTNVGTLKAAIVVEPLSSTCTKYLGAALEPDGDWVSNTSGSAIVLGSIYRPQAAEAFADASLAIEIDGDGRATASDYIHTPLTASSAVTLFAFSVDELQEDSIVRFDLANPSSEPLSFEAAFFSNDCPQDLDTSESEFVDRLPIGNTRVAERFSQPTGNGFSPTQRATSTVVPGTQEPRGQVMVEILSIREGPGFAYRQTGEMLRGEAFEILGRSCGSGGTYDWFLIGAVQDKEN